MEQTKETGQRRAILSFSRMLWLDSFPLPGAESPFPLLVEVSEVNEKTWGE